MMHDVLITLVFMMAILMFATFPAYKLSHFLKERYHLSSKKENFLTLIFTLVLALLAALFLKIG